EGHPPGSGRGVGRGRPRGPCGEDGQGRVRPAPSRKVRMSERGDSFPRQFARTRRFTLGRPRGFFVAPDGSRVAFLRSPAGDDPTTSLWVFDVEERRERLVADASDLLAGGSEELSAVERARRERTREQAGGIVA